MREHKIIESRLKRMLLQDKINAYEGLTKAIEGDIRLLLDCYMTLVGEVSVNIDILDSGEYQINICAKADNINSPNVI